MKLTKRSSLIVSAALLMFALPMLATAQGRGRGRGRGQNQNWKCNIFVNCHDARDGRWDGRGPRANRIGYRNGIYVSRGRRVRVRRHFNEDRFRRRDRDFDNDRFFRREGVRPSDRIFGNRDVFRGRRPGRP